MNIPKTIFNKLEEEHPMKEPINSPLREILKIKMNISII
jgi:hypothetical protein